MNSEIIQFPKFQRCEPSKHVRTKYNSISWMQCSVISSQLQVEISTLEAKVVWKFPLSEECSQLSQKTADSPTGTRAHDRFWNEISDHCARSKTHLQLFNIIKTRGSSDARPAGRSSSDQVNLASLETTSPLQNTATFGHLVFDGD